MINYLSLIMLYHRIHLYILDTKIFVQHFWRTSSFLKMKLPEISHQVNFFYNLDPVKLFSCQLLCINPLSP